MVICLNFKLLKGVSPKQGKYKYFKRIANFSSKGTIYDRYGRPLAVNKLAMSIKLDPSIDVDNRDEVLLNLVKLLEKNNEKLIDTFPLSLNRPFEFQSSKNEELNLKAEVFKTSKDGLTDEQKNMNGEEFFKVLREFFEIDETLNDSDARKLISLKYALYEKRYRKYQPITIATDIKDKTIAHLVENYERVIRVFILMLNQ